MGSYGHWPVLTVHPDMNVESVYALLEERGISAVPVVDGRRSAIGVISRTDLLRLGETRAGTGRRRILVELPKRSAAEVMHPGVVTVTSVTSVGAAAARMVRDRIHRVFVTDEGELAQVFGTREVMGALWEARVATPIAEVMSHKPFTIGVGAPLVQATQRLADAHVQGLVVVDEDDWPVGLFTQREALLARADDPHAPLEDRMSHALLCLDATTPLHRAAAQAAETRARRVLVVRQKRTLGVVSGLDFARAAARA